MVKNFLATPLGAAIAAFVRVFLAAVFGAWANAGFPINTLTGSAVDAYLQAGLVAAGALIGINAVGPWAGTCSSADHGTGGSGAGDR
jgi:fluoride ion exporter CrcB/FEX